jgi:oligopeptide/dipeptide ABC transporter ATP-binding protein
VPFVHVGIPMRRDEMLRVEKLKKYFPVRRSLAETLFSSGKRYIRAVDDVSFSLGRGEILGFVGESGCGKSTLSRTILRLVEPTGGRVYYEGEEVTCLGKKVFKALRRRMQMIFQDPFGSLNPRRTVADTLRQTIRIHGLAQSKAEESSIIMRTLEEVGLKPVDEFWDKYPALLSGGQLQRVSIGRVLVLQPRLVIADEPVSMLDVSVRIGILELLANMRDRFGISFVYITHDLVTARYICDRIAIMYLGKIVEIGETEKVLSGPVHPYTRALIAAVPVPDPKSEIPEVPIRGYVPATPDEPLHRCNFCPRCPHGIEQCREKVPELVQVGDDHYAACFKI